MLFTMQIIYMKTLFYSVWLQAVQVAQDKSKKCNTSVKSVMPVEITHRNSGL